MFDHHHSRFIRVRLAALILSLTLAGAVLAVPLSAGGLVGSVSAAPGDPVEVSQTSRPPRGGTATPRATTTPSTQATGQTTSTRPPRGGTATPAPTRPATQTPTGTTGQYGCPSAEELLMLRLINDYRARNGIGPVTLSPTLTNAAEFHSRDMAARNYFSHDLPGIASWSQNITNHGYSAGTRAENIAAGYGDAQRTFDQWVNSTPHRTNMLNPNLRAIGIGAAYGAGTQYGTYWTTTFGGPVDTQLSC